jgi:hypothetical protein
MVVVWDKLPDVPVMVTFALPVGAVPLAAKVSVLVPVVLAGMNEALTPAGRPETARLTMPLKLFCGVTLIVLEPLEPCAKLTLAGEADRAKLGGAFTVMLIWVVFVRLPDVPEIVTVAVPKVAVLLAVSVRVLVEPVLVGTKEAVTPAGKPEAVKLTFAEKLPMGTTVIVLELLEL